MILGTVSFYTRSKPHIHREGTPKFSLLRPTGSMPSVGMPGGIQFDSVTDTVTDSSLLSFVK